MNFFSFPQSLAVAGGTAAAIRLPQVQVVVLPSEASQMGSAAGNSIPRISAHPATHAAHLHASNRVHRAQTLAQSRTTIRNSAKRW